MNRWCRLSSCISCNSRRVAKPWQANNSVLPVSNTATTHAKLVSPTRQLLMPTHYRKPACFCQGSREVPSLPHPCSTSACPHVSPSAASPPPPILPPQGNTLHKWWKVTVRYTDKKGHHAGSMVRVYRVERAVVKRCATAERGQSSTRSTRSELDENTTRTHLKSVRSCSSGPVTLKKAHRSFTPTH